MGGLNAVQPFARLFMLPGVYHCQGGTGPSRVDYLSAIVPWVEQGKPPTQLIATQTTADTRSGGFSNPTQGTTENTAKVVRTRPIFPYPMQARYSGKGSVDEAANFVGVMPSQSVNGGFAPTQSADRINWIGNDLLQPQ